jgi:hypothetical protein
MPALPLESSAEPAVSVRQPQNLTQEERREGLEDLSWTPQDCFLNLLKTTRTFVSAQDNSLPAALPGKSPIGVMGSLYIYSVGNIALAL